LPRKYDHHKHLDASQPHRRWYKTARWQKLRWSILTRDRFTCQMPGCGKMEPDTSKLVCDHKEQHHGNEAKFWSGPFQTLCKDCHDSLKQGVEKAGYVKGSDNSGRPTDPNHHWNR
jgi:5-methylcytosine-specific restriction protein A